jgi:hypothetical protein
VRSAQNTNLISGLSDDLITLTVGPDGATASFQVYRSLLCHYSNYFDDILNGDFKEADSSELSLANVEANIFQIFFHWIITGVIDCTYAFTPTRTAWVGVIKAYIFADVHEANYFRKTLLDFVFLHIERTRTFLTCALSLLYAKPLRGDHFRKFVVDVTAEISGTSLTRPTHALGMACHSFVMLPSLPASTRYTFVLNASLQDTYQYGPRR